MSWRNGSKMYTVYHTALLFITRLSQTNIWYGGYRCTHAHRTRQSQSFFGTWVMHSLQIVSLWLCLFQNCFSAANPLKRLRLRPHPLFACPLKFLSHTPFWQKIPLFLPYAGLGLSPASLSINLRQQKPGVN